jgi:hypothetical protein
MFFSNKLNKKRSLLCGLPAHKAYEQNYKICRGCGEDEKALSLLVKVTNKNWLHSSGQTNPPGADVHLANNHFLIEKCRLLDKFNMAQTCLILYDSGGGINLLKPGRRDLDRNKELRHSQPLILNTVNGAESKRHPVLNVFIILEKESSKKEICVYSINTYEMSFPLAEPSPSLFNTKLRSAGEQFATIPTHVELAQLPAICLGIENLQKHPLEIPEDQVPNYIRTKYPNAVVLRSRITDKLILAGNVGASNTISNLILPNKPFSPSAIFNLVLPGKPHCPDEIESPTPRERTPAPRDKTPAPRDKTPAPRDKTPAQVSFSPMVETQLIPRCNRGQPVPTNGWSFIDSSHTPPISTSIHLLNTCLMKELAPRVDEELWELSEAKQGSEYIDNKEGEDSPMQGENLSMTENKTEIARSHKLYTCDDSEPCIIRKIFSQCDSQSFKANVYLYKMYQADLREFLQEPHKSIDIQSGKIGCSSCDPRHSILTSSAVSNNSLLISRGPEMR